MSLFELLLLAVGLSMDAFAVSVCKGLAMRKAKFKHMLIAGAWFGAFQGIMPFTGYILGIQFERFITAFAPWCAFILLALIGGNMLRETLSGGDDDDDATATMHIKEMFVLAVATSIDALAVGITFACVPVSLMAASPMINTVIACLIIAATTCVISMAGVKIGNVFGAKYKQKAEIAGGVILVLLGIKILLEHLLG